MNKRKFNDKIILIFKQTIKDEINRPILKEKYRKNIFGEILSTHINDYFIANQQTLKMEHKIIIYKHNFSNENYVEINLFGTNKEFFIKRIYDPKNDYLELFLTDNIGE